MKHILAAAAALQEFSTIQLAAYCGTDPGIVEDLLSGLPDLVEPAARQCWRVLDLAGIRAAAASDTGSDRSVEPTPPPAGSPAPITDRLVLAEEMLVECGHEDSADLRRAMTETVRNNLRQVIARVSSSPTPWWDIQASQATWNAVAAATDDPALSASRLRADFTLANIIDAEAAGQPVRAELLTQAASDLSRVATATAGARLRQIFEYFVELATILAEPAGLTAPSESAPARLLVALAWHRARALVGVDIGRAAKTFAQILHQLSRRPRTLDRHAIDLYRLVERAPGGGDRVVVYRGLLDLLPQPAHWCAGGAFQPGVLVEAITDHETSSRLQNFAWRLREGLERSPFQSESALIGGAAHVLHDVAMATAAPDGDVLPRSDAVRRELLQLAGVPV